MGIHQDLVPREIQFPETPNKIKVAIGMRRTGKTYFIYQHILKLLDSGIDQTTILYLNFEDDRLLPFNQQKLAALVEAFYSFYPENHEKKCYGRLFESMIYLELKRLGCQVYYYLTNERYEVDFLVQAPSGHKKLFQVAWRIDDNRVFERENRALQVAMQELEIEGEIITLDSYLRGGVKTLLNEGF